jgi:YHS domain-containing protein/uncharacterized membrane protein
MKRKDHWRLMLLSFFIVLSAGAPSVALSAEQSLPNPYCPVLTDEKSDPALMVEYQGKKVYFCCGKCLRKFNAEPEKYLHNLPQFQEASSSPVAKQDGTSAATAGGDHHEEKEHGEESEAEGGPKTLLEFAGHLHLVAVHFPVALVLVAALFELIGLLYFRERMAGATRAILWVAGLCTVGTAVTGWILASFESYNAALGEILTFHRWGGTSLAVLLLVTLAFREKAERGGLLRWKTAYRVGLLAAAVLTVLVAHWGGQLVHGPEFLELPS